MKRVIETGPPISMVLLHRKPRRYSQEEILLAVERAWRISIGVDARSSHFVVEADGKAFLYVGSHLISFLSVDKPYLAENANEREKQLPQRAQKEAWAEHVAWTALDYLKSGNDVELEYCVLAKLVAELIDSDCTALYVPGESSLIPNDKSLYDDLQKIAAARDSGIR